MEPSVDLTKDRILSNRERLSLKDLYSKIQMETLFSLSTRGTQKGLIPTGNSEERDYKMKYMNVHEHLYCDCCGGLIKEKPWDKVLDEYGMLCNICMSQFIHDKSEYLFNPPQVKSVVIRIDGEKRRENRNV